MVEQLSEANVAFSQKLESQFGEGKFVCTGLDPDIEKIYEYYPELLPHGVDSDVDVYSAITNFNRLVVEQTVDLTAAYKLDPGFYYQYLGGEMALTQTIKEIKMRSPSTIVIVDAKYGGTARANTGYANYAFGRLGADAVTVRPVGVKALQPFLQQIDKGVFVVVRTSDIGSDEVELQEIQGGRDSSQSQLRYIFDSLNAANNWNQNGNCGLVVAATHPDGLAAVRTLAPSVPILVPAVGAQGGDAATAMRVGQDANGQGILASASRLITYPSLQAGSTHQEAVRDSFLQLHNQLKHSSLLLAEE